MLATQMRVIDHWSPIGRDTTGSTRLGKEGWERGLAAADLSLEVRSPKLLGHTEARKEIRVGDAGRARNNTGS